MQYSYIPLPETFKRDSSVSWARRSSDPVLTRIDNLLSFYQRRRFATQIEDQLMALAALTDLFMATRYWVRLAANAQNHATLKPERLPAVQALHGAVVEALRQQVGCSDAAAVAQFVTDFKCRTLTDHGAFIDQMVGDTVDTATPPSAYYFNTLRRQATAVRFENGVAYRMSAKGTQRMVKLNSADFESPLMRANVMSMKGWAPFAMGEEGDLYMTRHFIGENDEGNVGHEKIYHSTYTGGGPLVAAGTMLVVDGLILGMRGDSGHYKPTDHNLTEALRVLATRGVKVQRIKVHDWNADNPRPPMRAMDFIASQRQNFIRQLGAKKQAALQRAQAPAVTTNNPATGVAAVHLAPVPEVAEYWNV